MRLAIIDPNGKVILEWPSTGEAHADLADKLAAAVHPGRLSASRRRKLADRIRAHILELQRETIRL